VLKVLKESGRDACPERTIPVAAAPPRWPTRSTPIARVHADARKLANEQHDFAGALRVLEAIPDHLRDRVLFDASFVGDADAVAGSMRPSARRTARHAPPTLRAKIAALLALQPQREDLRRLLASLPTGPNPGDVFSNDLGMRSPGYRPARSSWAVRQTRKVIRPTSASTGSR